MCSHCINCFCIEEVEDDGVHDDYYCLLGLSQEELQTVIDEINKGASEDTDSYYSDSFKKIMGFEHLSYPNEGVRYVNANACCNLFEYIGMTKEEEKENV